MESATNIAELEQTLWEVKFAKTQWLTLVTNITAMVVIGIANLRLASHVQHLE